MPNILAARLPRIALLCALVLLPASPLHVAAQDAVWDHPPVTAQRAHSFKALVFSRTTGFRHESIASGIAAVSDLAAQHGFEVVATEDPAVFTDAGLAGYAVVIFLNTTGDILSLAQQRSFERFIEAGGGFVGVHSAADTEYDWAWYGGLVGAYFESHPPGTHTAVVEVADRVHPSTDSLPQRWQRHDEWYNFRANPRGKVHILATLDESTFTGGADGFDHPIAWCHPYQGGRSWYTAGGHTDASYAEPLFRDHLMGGILYAAGEGGDCEATLESGFEVVTLDEGVENPMELAVAADGRVLYVERGGAVKVYNPLTATTTVAARLSVTTALEDGLLGIALDPAFAENGWVYLFYSPAGTVAKQHLSRFTMTGDVLDLTTERILLEIPTQRQQCCHAGGSLTFGPDGLLYISTGDNTDPFESDGYTPIDERAGRSAWDAQKSSGNTNDLRGKILRIRPLADGTYEVPEGNLFPNGAGGRPEIYVMGNRNPFRISVDRATGWLYWGEVGPDARQANTARGPMGYDEWNQAREAGNYGWPYCIADNQPYRDFNFATRTSGAAFNCAAPVNTSPNNTGAQLLPPARPAWIWYPYDASPHFPEITAGNGRTAMAGPVYHYDSLLASPIKLPAYYDNTLFIYEWSRNWIKEVKLDEDGEILQINPFLPGLTLRNPIDLELGPDGALYLLEWGGGFQGDSPEAKLVRIGYPQGNRAPIARVDVSPTAGAVPLTVQFSAARSIDPDAGDDLSFAWSFDGDETPESTAPSPAFTYTEAGDYVARLTVSDDKGGQTTTTIPITAGNTPPVVMLEWPANGGFYAWGDSIRYRVRVDDHEDGGTAAGAIDCEQVVVTPSVGHDDHAHPLVSENGCEGVFATPPGHGTAAEDVYFVIEAEYEDAGAPGVSPLRRSARHILRPHRLEAEHFAEMSGVQLESTGDVMGGGRNVGYIDHGDFLVFYPVSLENIDFITYRVASAGTGGRIEVRIDSTDGPLVSTAHVEPTGAWQTYTETTAAVNAPGGSHALYFVFLRQPGSSGLFNINWMDFHGAGVAETRDGASANGLRASYFHGTDLQGEPVQRVDPMVNFNWSLGAPLDGFATDGFSVRWEGKLRPDYTQNYTFYTRAQDGMRVWIDGKSVITYWQDGLMERSSAPVSLTAGTLHELVVEYYHGTGGAQANLRWSSPSTPKSVIPSRALFAEAGTGVGNEQAEPVPAVLTLDSPRPNPASGPARVRFALPAAASVKLELFDLLGRRVAVVAEGPYPAGAHEADLDTASLASGTYLVRLATPMGTLTRRMVVVR